VIADWWYMPLPARRAESATLKRPARARPSVSVMRTDSRPRSRPRSSAILVSGVRRSYAIARITSPFRSPRSASASARPRAVIAIAERRSRPSLSAAYSACGPFGPTPKTRTRSAPERSSSARANSFGCNVRRASVTSSSVVASTWSRIALGSPPASSRLRPRRRAGVARERSALWSSAFSSGSPAYPRVWAVRITVASLMASSRAISAAERNTASSRCRAMNSATFASAGESSSWSAAMRSSRTAEACVAFVAAMAGVL